MWIYDVNLNGTKLSFLRIGKLKEDLERYAEAKRKLTEIEVQEGIAKVSVIITILTFVSISILFAALFGSIALAHSLNGDQAWFGYAVVAGLQILITLLILIITRYGRGLILGRAIQYIIKILNQFIRFVFSRH